MEKSILSTVDKVVQMPRARVQMNRDDAFILDTLGQVPITFHRSFVEITGGVTSALWLSWAVRRLENHQRLLKESGTKQLDDSGLWFESNHQDCERDTGLTRREQDTARRMLREKKFLHERNAHRGKGFRIDFHALASLLMGQSAEEWSQYATLISPPGSASASLTDGVSPPQLNVRNVLGSA